MSPKLRVYAGRFDYPKKGEDRYLVFPLGENASDGFVAAIADGVSGNNGSIAANWVIATLERLVTAMSPDLVTADAIYEGLLEALSQATTESDKHSATTLSCGVFKAIAGKSSMVFDFFALGDSPIWKVVPSASGEYKYQAHQVYCEIKPARQSAVYSSVGTSPYGISGRPYFGSVRVDAGETLLVMSDGLPMDTILWDDQLAKHRDSPYLLDLVMSRTSSGNASESLVELSDALAAYWRANLLIDDDASLVALAVVAETEMSGTADSSHLADAAGGGDLWDDVEFAGEESGTVVNTRPEPATREASEVEMVEHQNSGFSAASNVGGGTSGSLESESDRSRKVPWVFLPA